MNCYFNSHLVIRNNFVPLNFFLNFTGKRPNMLDADSLWARKGLYRTASSVNKDPDLEVSSKEGPINLLLTTS